MYVLQRGEESSLILLGINVDIHHFLNTAACFYFLAVLEPLVSHMTLWSVTLFGVTKHIHALSQMHKKPGCMEGEQYINTQSNTQSFGQLWRDFPWWSVCRLSSKKKTMRLFQRKTMEKLWSKASITRDAWYCHGTTHSIHPFSAAPAEWRCYCPRMLCFLIFPCCLGYDHFTQFSSSSEGVWWVWGSRTTSSSQWSSRWAELAWHHWQGPACLKPMCWWALSFRSSTNICRSGGLHILASCPKLPLRWCWFGWPMCFWNHICMAEFKTIMVIYTWA